MLLWWSGKQSGGVTVGDGDLPPETSIIFGVSTKRDLNNRTGKGFPF